MQYVVLRKSVTVLGDSYCQRQDSAGGKITICQKHQTGHRKTMRTLIKNVFVVLSLFLLVGCKEIVYANLSEREANEIVAVLFAQGIEAGKEPQKENLYAVSVLRREFGPAIVILSKSGLPRESFRTIGDLFPDDSVVGSPFEERVRFSYALSEELSRTLTEIEGVQHARVHVVIPERTRFQESVEPSRASLAIHHTQDFVPSENIPQMKKLVAFAVPHLAYDDVSVSLFPASGVNNIAINQPVERQAASLFPLAYAEGVAGAEHMPEALGKSSAIATSLMIMVGGLILLWAVLQLVMTLGRYLRRICFHGSN